MQTKYTKTQIVLEIVCLLTLVAFLVRVAMVWNTLPARVPVHFDLHGKIDGWGDKSAVWFVPGVASFCWLLMTTVAFFPKSWNMPCRIREECISRVYGFMKTTLILLKLEVVALFTVIGESVVRGVALHPAFAVSTVAVVLVTAGAMIVGVFVLNRPGRVKEQDTESP